MMRKINVRDVTKPIESLPRIGVDTTSSCISKCATPSSTWNASIHRAYHNTTSSVYCTASSNENDSSQLDVPQPPISIIGVQRPNRFTTAYNQMQITCPEQIEIYAKCVVAAQQQQKEEHAIISNSSGSTYNLCGTEFVAVKECFRSVRRQLLQQVKN